jgi:Cytochrome bd terminal oxidase subunit I
VPSSRAVVAAHGCHRWAHETSQGERAVSDHVMVDRLQFTLTITFHYLFPILTMGVALFIAWLKTVSYLGREDHRFPLWRKTQAERDEYESAARFWAKIFAANFAVGVVTGHPDGVSVRDQLGEVLRLRRRGDRHDAGDGRGLLDGAVLP